MRLCSMHLRSLHLLLHSDHEHSASVLAKERTEATIALGQLVIVFVLVFVSEFALSSVSVFAVVAVVAVVSLIVGSRVRRKMLARGLRLCLLDPCL